MSVTARIVALICVLVLAAGAFAAPPEKLELRDLINHPERLPAKVTVSRDFNFGGGSSIAKGQSVSVVEFSGGEIVLDAGNGVRFGAEPADCDLLEAANAAWAKLTPAQREIEPAMLVKDQSLWPAKVNTTVEIGLQNGTVLPVGTEFNVVAVERDGVQIASAEHDANFKAAFAESDIVARARELAAIAPEERPSRIAAALSGMIVDAEGKPAAKPDLDKSKVFVFYYTASWCGPCRQFSPKLVKYIGEVASANPYLTIVIMSQDEEDAKLRAYMKESKMLWPAVTLSNLRKSHVLSSYAGTSIPQLVVVDRFGKPLANSYQKGRYIPPDQVMQGLKSLVDSGAAR